jgi:hypothetical protein
MALQVDAAAAAAAAAVEAPAAPSPPAQASEVAIAPPPETMEGPAASAPPPALLRSRKTGTAGGTWAVIVGINDYPGTTYDLKSAVNDADDVDKALAALKVPADRRLVLRDGQASRKTLQASVDWLVAHAGPDAVAVFFFAGHVRKLAPGREGMVTADGGTVTDADLASRLANLSARRAWIGMAACYGGGFTEVLRPGRVLTGAASATERAYENSAFGRSYMVEYMVRQAMLEGRASDSVQAAFGYARDALARDYPNRVPVQLDYSTAPLDLRPPGSVPPPKPPPSQPSPAGPGGGQGSTSGTSGTPSAGGTSSTQPETEEDSEWEGCKALGSSLLNC